MFLKCLLWGFIWKEILRPAIKCKNRLSAVLVVTIIPVIADRSF